ncbi:MAG TPA: TetR/AcrR family transcriptional regulator [Vicinamibacteria bacterium]
MQIPASFEAAWGAREQPTKGPRPALSLDRILSAAITLADREGLDGVSMARVAAEVGSAPMSLYRYVATKDELLLLMVDTALGPPPEPDGSAPGWRQGLGRWGTEIYERYLHHAWAVRVPISGPPLTPNNIRWLEAALATLAGTPLGENEKLSCVLLVSGYARSQALLIAEMMAGSPTHRPGEEPGLDYWGILRQLAAPDLFPHLQPVIAAQEEEDAARESATGARAASGDLSADALAELGGEVHFGLERILDGIESLMNRRLEG